MSVCNLGEFRAFWDPTKRALVARSVFVRRAFAIPPDAILVGTYRAPCAAATFIDDLKEVLRRPPPAPEAPREVPAAPLTPARELIGERLTWTSATWRPRPRATRRKASP